MKALITGASSGIGKDIAKILDRMGHKVYLVARREELLIDLAKELSNEPESIVCDLSKKENAIKLYDDLKDEGVDILINNAGFGLFGEFLETDLSKELEMIDVNIVALHILTKKFLADFKKRNSGYILNVASSASFLPGPLMATYYATKAYVQRLTLAIYEELRKKKSNVKVSVLCPGPVDTEFNSVAGVKFNLSSLKSVEVAEYAVRRMFKKKPLIIPGKLIKLGVFFQRFLPMKLLIKISYRIQKSKDE